MTNLSRRRFFGLLGGTAATYFLPPIGGWKSDVIINPTQPIPGEWFWRLEQGSRVLYWSKNLEPILKIKESDVRLNYKIDGFKA